MKSSMIFVLILVVFCGCGASTNTKEDNLKNATNVTIFGKTLRLKNNDLYQSSCNQFYFDFIATNDFGSCKAGKATVDLENIWTIKSLDSTISISATMNKSTETLTIEGIQYYCYLYSGSVYDASGEEKFQGSHLLLVKSVTAKPSELKPDDVFLLASSSAEVCASF